MDLKPIRIERLKLLAKRRGVDGPVELGKLIGKKTNQTSDLLDGRASFGEKVARSIEKAAELPPGWLDVVDGQQSPWPFTDELRVAVQQLEVDDLTRLENVMRAHLDLPPLYVTPALSAIRGGRAGHTVHERVAPSGKKPASE